MVKEFGADSFDFEAEFERINREISKPNILVCGATGVGKSSFVNEVFGKGLAQVGDGMPITKGVRRYEREDTKLVLYDSEGYEIGGERQDYYKEEIIGVIDKYREEYPDDFKEQIHQVWYFISAANKRVTETDIEVVDLIKGKNVPVTIVLTQIDNVDGEELRDMSLTIERDFQGIEYFTVSSVEDTEIRKAIEPYNEKQELIEWALENLNDSLKDGFILSLNKNLETTKKHVNRSIIPKYVGTAVATAATPIPFSDATILTPMQMTMSVHIMRIYGIDKGKSGITGIINSTIISQVGRNLASTIAGNVAKLIPGFGSIIGGTINAGVAASLTAALGYSISELSYKYAQSVIDGEPIPLSEVFDSDIIKETIKHFYKSGEK